MGDQHHSHAFVGEVAHYLQYFTHQLRIECRCGFVKQHQGRIHGQSSRNGDTLLLAARQRRWIVLGFLCQANSLKHPQRLGLGVGCIRLLNAQQRFGNILQSGHVCAGL
ncbi:hypothetical protein D3C85_1163070 [compost metagenome]